MNFKEMIEATFDQSLKNVVPLGESTLIGTIITIPISTIFLMVAYDQVVHDQTANS